jgi:hypothetical protein
VRHLRDGGFIASMQMTEVHFYWTPRRAGFVNHEMGGELDASPLTINAQTATAE